MSCATYEGPSTQLTSSDSLQFPVVTHLFNGRAARCALIPWDGKPVKIRMMYVVFRFHVFFLISNWNGSFSLQTSKSRVRTRATTRGNREQTAHQQPSKQPARSQVREKTLPKKLCYNTVLQFCHWHMRYASCPCTILTPSFGNNWFQLSDFNTVLCTMSILSHPCKSHTYLSVRSEPLTFTHVEISSHTVIPPNYLPALFMYCIAIYFSFSKLVWKVFPNFLDDLDTVVTEVESCEWIWADLLSFYRHLKMQQHLAPSKNLPLTELIVCF